MKHAPHVDKLYKIDLYNACASRTTIFERRNQMLRVIGRGKFQIIGAAYLYNHLVSTWNRD